MNTVIHLYGKCSRLSHENAKLEVSVFSVQVIHIAFKWYVHPIINQSEWAFQWALKFLVVSHDDLSVLHSNGEMPLLLLQMTFGAQHSEKMLWVYRVLTCYVTENLTVFCPGLEFNEICFYTGYVLECLVIWDCKVGGIWIENSKFYNTSKSVLFHLSTLYLLETWSPVSLACFGWLLLLLWDSQCIPLEFYYICCQ